LAAHDKVVLVQALIFLVRNEIVMYRHLNDISGFDAPPPRPDQPPYARARQPRQYHVPMNADAHDIKVISVKQPDHTVNSLGIKGLSSDYGVLQTRQQTGKLIGPWQIETRKAIPPSRQRQRPARMTAPHPAEGRWPRS